MGLLKAGNPVARLDSWADSMHLTTFRQWDACKSRVGLFSLHDNSRLRMPLSLGNKIGPYEIVALLGVGGMGEVMIAAMW
jgi:hypothetical protein